MLLNVVYGVKGPEDFSMLLVGLIYLMMGSIIISFQLNFVCRYKWGNVNTFAATNVLLCKSLFYIENCRSCRLREGWKGCNQSKWMPNPIT